MSRTVSLAAAAAVLVSGIVAALLLAWAPASAAPHGLMCPRQANPTVNDTEQRACLIIFGP